MANTIKWSGIEQAKYGLTARWYVSAYYGNDIDVYGVGYYNPSTNPTGHGGPTRPFASRSKINQDAAILAGHVVVYDSGSYLTGATWAKSVIEVGDGLVTFSKFTYASSLRGYNITFLEVIFSSFPSTGLIDCIVLYSNLSSRGSGDGFFRNVFIETSLTTASGTALGAIENNILIRTAWNFSNSTTSSFKNNVIISCPDIVLNIIKPRPVGVIFDYCTVIGTVKTSVAINGKTTGVTVEDFKADGNYFVKSYSEVDLFGNPSGSGATVTQLQTLFNNYFSPVYLDTWQDLDLSLKPTASNLIKFGGLNGTYIGALPVGHYFSGETLWNTYKDAINTSNIDYDILSKGLVITAGQEFGTFRSTRISLGAPYILEPINFFANLVYNADGTPRQGVSNQRIDTTPDDLPDNTKNQRVVYDFRLQYSETVGGALTPFLNFELNRTPAVDNSGRSNLDAAFVELERKKIKVADFIIELTLRRIIID